MGSGRSGRGDHHDLDIEPGRRQPGGFDTGPARGLPRRDPGIPHRVHLVVVVHAVEPDCRRQQFALIGTTGREQPVDTGADVPGLLGDAFPLGVDRDLPGEIDRAVMDHGLAHPRADVVTLNAHDFVPCK